VRRSLVALAVVDVLLVVSAAACSHTVDRATSGSGSGTAASGPVSADTPAPPLPAPRTVTGPLVLARPWPARVTPTAAWTAALDGVGGRVTLSAVSGVVPGGMSLASLKLASTDPRPGATTPPPSDNVHLALPDGSRWYPLDAFRLDAAADLPFTSAAARDGTVTVSVASWAAMLAAAPDPVTAVGTFVTVDGRRVDRLTLPRATKVVHDCPPSTPSCPISVDAPAVTLAAHAGTVLRASTTSASGEAAVAGSARAQALGRRWDSLVGAVEGTDLTSTATWDGRTWTLTASVRGARQVWVDVWPVADTTLAATSGINSHVHNCLRNCDLRVRWVNTGFATSQIYEAEGIGPGASIGFDLNKSLGHDAGLGIGRGDRKINLGGGGDVDSNQPPGEKVDRGLSYTPGDDVTLVLRGNFPDTRVHLAIPAA
jgi:hypothetical protein